LPPKAEHIGVAINPWERRELIEGRDRIVWTRNCTATNCDYLNRRTLNIAQEDTRGGLASRAPLAARTEDDNAIGIDRGLIIAIKQKIRAWDEVAIVDDNIK
jgi:hypothetical protein